jgi:hypothetical protein
VVGQGRGVETCRNRLSLSWLKDQSQREKVRNSPEWTEPVDDSAAITGSVPSIDKKALGMVLTNVFIANPDINLSFRKFCNTFHS